MSNINHKSKTGQSPICAPFFQVIFARKYSADFSHVQGDPRLSYHWLVVQIIGSMLTEV